MRLFEDAFYNLSRTYTTNNIYPIIADTSYVKNVSGRDVIGRNHTDRGRMATKVSMLKLVAKNAHSFSIDSSSNILENR